MKLISEYLKLGNQYTRWIISWISESWLKFVYSFDIKLIEKIN